MRGKNRDPRHACPRTPAQPDPLRRPDKPKERLQSATPRRHKVCTTCPAAPPTREEIENVNIIDKIGMLRSMTDRESEKLLKLLAALPKNERLNVMDRHRNYYIIGGLDEDSKNYIVQERRDNPAQLDLDLLILALLDYQRDLRKSGRSAELITTIRNQSRRRKIERLRKDTFIIRLRGIFAEITNLREVENLSWPQIAVYLRRAHRKYFGDRPINADYLRRAYNKLAAERQDLRSAVHPV